MNKINLILGAMAVALVVGYMATGMKAQPVIAPILSGKQQWIEQICKMFPGHEVKIIQ